MGRQSKHLLGRAIDIAEPGLDQESEVRAIVESYLEEYREGKATRKSTLRRLAHLRRVIKHSKLPADRKLIALEYIERASMAIKGSTKSSTKKKGKKKSSAKKGTKSYKNSKNNIAFGSRVFWYLSTNLYKEKLSTFSMSSDEKTPTIRCDLI